MRCKVAIKTDSFTKAVLERYKDKANILYVEPKEETIIGTFFTKRRFDLPGLRKGNICKQMAKWQIVPDVWKSENMRRHFEASSIIKCDKGKGNENVIRFDWKKCFPFSAFLRVFFVIHPGVFCKNCKNFAYVNLQSKIWTQLFE